jgi:chromosome segregation ATPase
LANVKLLVTELETQNAQLRFEKDNISNLVTETCGKKLSLENELTFARERIASLEKEKDKIQEKSHSLTECDNFYSKLFILQKNVKPPMIYWHNFGHLVLETLVYGL